MQVALYKYRNHLNLVAKLTSFHGCSLRKLRRQGRSYRKIHFVLWIALLSLSICHAHYNPLANKKKVLLVSSNTSFQRSQKEWRSYYSQQRSRYNSRSFGTIDYSTKFLSMDEVKRDRRARIFNVDFKRRRLNHMSITSRLIWLTLLAFGVQVWKPKITEMGMKISDRILRGEQLYRLVTPILLHGGLLHLGTNMISLQRVGNDVEKLFGPYRYLSLYIASGVCGNLMSAWRSPNPSLGASGSVFGIVGAYFVFLNRNEWLLGETGKAITDAVGQTMITNVFLGLLLPQIDQWGHVGGAIGGGLISYMFGPRLYLSEFSSGDETEMRRPQRVIIDRPIVCVPHYLEIIPKRIDNSLTHVTTWFNTRILNRLVPSSVQPWQLNPRARSNFYMRQDAPNRSLKPGPVD
jgi:membrane associated rhomboid family serine protease